MKKGRDVKVGDVLMLENGEKVSIKKVSKGIIQRHVHVDLSNGDWAEIGFDDVLDLET